MRVFALSLMVCLPGASRTVAGDAPKPPVRAPASIELRDQYDAPQRLAFPATNVVVLTIADKKGSEQIDGWVAALKAGYAGRIELRGLAEVGGVPGLLRGKVRKKFQETRAYPVMMDWSGTNCAALHYQKNVANVLVIGRDGSILGHATGPAREPALKELLSAIDAALLRACPKIPRGPVFAPKAGWRGATKENILPGSSTEEQRSQAAFGAKTLRAAGLLSVDCVGSVLTARVGDARTSPPWPQPKSLAAGPRAIFGHALNSTSVQSNSTPKPTAFRLP